MIKFENKLQKNRFIPNSSSFSVVRSVIFMTIFTCFFLVGCSYLQKVQDSVGMVVDNYDLEEKVLSENQSNGKKGRQKKSEKTGTPMKISIKDIYHYGQLADIVKDDKNVMITFLKKHNYDSYQIQELGELQIKYMILKKNQRKYIVIRGTKNIKNMMTDISVLPKKDKVLNIYIHEGFCTAAKTLYQILQFSHSLKKSTNTIIIGHSLAGAVGAILGFYMHKDNFSVEKIVTFGQPKFTNKKGLQKYDMIPYIRVVASNDIITIMPPPVPLSTYHHGGFKLFFDSEKYVYKKVGNPFNARDDMALPKKITAGSALQILSHLMTSYLEKIKPHSDKELTIAFEKGYFWDTQ